MKFKSRLPLSSEPFVPASRHPRPARRRRRSIPSLGPRRRVTKGEALAGAFEAVAQVVRREMESLKRAIVGLESQLLRRVETEKEGLASAISSLRQDMISRVDELRQAQQKALGEMNEQTKSRSSACAGSSSRRASTPTPAPTRSNPPGADSHRSRAEAGKGARCDDPQSVGMRVDLEQQIATGGPRLEPAQRPPARSSRIRGRCPRAALPGALV